MTTTLDPRVVPIEQNLYGFFRAFRDWPVLTFGDDPDAISFTSDVPFPLFNAVIGTRFRPADAAERTAVLLDRFVARGLPFAWWLLPSSRSADLEAALVQRGLTLSGTPTGMFTDLTDVVPDEPLPANLTIDPVDAGNLDEAADVLVAGFDLPAEIREPARALLGYAGIPFGTTITHLLARLDGRPVGLGTVAVVNGVAGLYDIAVLEDARGHGVGRAVTVALMRLGRRRGGKVSVLHATPMGRPVYARLGYKPMCEIPQYVWLPGYA